jgi:hypothetical protein
MFRTLMLLLCVFVIAVSSPAQVTVTNQGFATTPGPAVPATPVSPPVLYAPIVHLDQGPTQPTQPSTVGLEAPDNEQGTVQLAAASGRQQPFNFGVAQFDTPSMQGGVGQPVNGLSLGEFARQLRQSQGQRNARTYTNSDIESLKQPAGTTANDNRKADNWVPNNGVIDPNGITSQTPVPQNSIAAPMQASPPSPDANPFGPKAAPAKPRAPAASKPRAEANGVGAGQVRRAVLAVSEAQGSDETQLPQTASKLPLMGALGFFSVSMGIFVRYQRSKTK